MPTTDCRTRTRPGRVRWNAILVWGLVVAGVIFGGWWLSRPAPTGSSKLASAADLDACVSHGGLSMHIHPHLKIIVDGAERPIPSNVGVSGDCLRPMHTHDGSGLIHIESYRVRDFTIANFFTIWQESYTAETFMDVQLTGKQILVFVDGQPANTGSHTVMRDRTSYAIVVGGSTETLIAPPVYVFPSNI